MSANILLLDTEERVFKAINRLIRPFDAVLVSSPSVTRALDTCHQREIQLVIADTNLPGIDVADFFAQVSRIQPLTRKMVLTSYADLDQTMAAINEGKINRYFTKPWDPDLLRAAIVEELDEYDRQHANAEALGNLGQEVRTLERKADFTAQLLRNTTDYLASARYHAAVDMLLPLLELRRPGARHFAYQVAERAETVCRALGLGPTETEAIRTAAELHQVGMLGLDDDAVSQPLHRIDPALRDDFERYAVLGADLIEDAELASIIRHHRENFRGDGQPDQLVADFIPLGARILRACADFQAISDQFGEECAVSMIEAQRGQTYDPDIAGILCDS